MHKAIVRKKNGRGYEEIYFERELHNDYFGLTIFSIGEYGEKEQHIIPDERIKAVIYDENIPHYD